jgi:6-pyruvoyl-tetrahydropterin synthase
MSKTGKLVISATAALAVILWGGCKTAAPKPSGFLSDYSHLQKADDSTWRYVDNAHLASYQKFMVSPVKVMVKEYWGTTFTADQQERIAMIFRQKIVNALSERYMVVGNTAADTAEVRAAITRAYRVGNSLALGVEAEILDPATHQQLAALQGVQIGPPEMGFRMGYHNPADSGNFMAAWWTWPSAVELMDRWANQLRNIVEDAHKR